VRRTLLVAVTLLLGGSVLVASPPPPVTAQPQPEAALAGAVQVSVGIYHSCALLTNGQVRCWGYNAYGQLGDGTIDDSPRAVVVRALSGPGPLTGVRQVAVGRYHTCALLTNGQVRCWGHNTAGQLGIGNLSEHHRPVAVLNAAGTGRLTGVRQLSTEYEGGCATLTNGQARCWGSDDYGELGNGPPTPDAVSLPVAVRAVAGSGPLTGVAAMAGGYDTNCALLTNRQIRCWGDSTTNGSLGNGVPDVDSPRPTIVRNVADTGPLTAVRNVAHSGYHGCANLTNGQVRCWGENDTAQLGNNTLDPHDTPVVTLRNGATGPLTNVQQVGVGTEFSCALLTNGQVRCWGANDYGQVGVGSIDAFVRPVPQDVAAPSGNGNLTGVVQVDVGDSHTCVVRSNREVRCWGYGIYGQLGNGAEVTRGRPVLVVV